MLCWRGALLTGQRVVSDCMPVQALLAAAVVMLLGVWPLCTKCVSAHVPATPLCVGCRILVSLNSFVPAVAV
jgi:hypothetical protein